MVTRDIFDAAKNYCGSVMQSGRPIMDADANDGRRSLLEVLRHLGSMLGVEGFVDDGFLVEECSAHPKNNFNVHSGYGAAGGHPFKAATTTERNLDAALGWPNRNLQSVVETVSVLDLGDSRMNWPTNAHLNKTLYVLRQTDNVILTYTISANSSTALTVQPADDLVADGVLPGDPYCIVCSSPVLDRTDLACLNCFLDTVDSSEDEDLLHPFGAGIECDQRWKIRTVLEVVEDVSSVDPVSDLPAEYVDALDRYHYYLPLASIDRTGGVDSIFTADITDLRDTITQLGSYVRKSGDAMTGNLRMAGNVVSGTLGSVDFGAGTLDDFVSGTFEEVVLHDASYVDVDAVSLVGSFPAGALRSRLYAKVAGSSLLAWVSGADPRQGSDFATKSYVDGLVESHVHTEYVEKEALDAMMARWDPDDVEGAVVAAYGNTYLQPDEYVEWSHGLSSDFLLVQVSMVPATGDFAGKWIDALGSVTWSIEDDDTLRITNKSLANIEGRAIRVFAMTTRCGLVMTVSARWSADSRSTATAGLVTVP